MTTGLTRGKTLDSAQLGGVIRAARLEKGLTLAQMSEQTGLSASFLSQLENGRTNTSLRSLQTVADALDTTATVLLADADTGADPVARADDELLTLSDKPDAQVRSLVRGKKALRGLEFTGSAHDDREFTHAHDEIMYVIDGSAHATLSSADGDREETLRAGDSLYIDAGVPHRWRALSDDTRVLLFSVADDMVIRRSSRRDREK
ncbi:MULTISPECIES: helix-turn-helix domain-containing protein [Gordonia]|uniref:helix-turn-helix domain-containing protein n=1 Tax=Gordonia TaxID=2053 RepID=UPI000AA23276|nr:MULTISPECIES: XRE family transcriptional regulator [Gordonia]MCM3895135.1 XRE family transcriptional regulator [Gordonia sputi]